MCDCANRIVSTGRNVGARTGTPAGMPAGMPDPNCPTCRVGAFAAGDARPPMPFAQKVMPAGQGGQGGRTHDLSDFKSLSIGRPRVVVATAPNVNPATVLSQLGNVTCAQWTALPATEKTRLMTWWLTTYAPSSGIAYSTASIYAQIIRMGQYCNAVANQNSQTVPNIQNVRPSGQSIAASPPGQTWFTTLGVQWLAANKSSCATWSTASRAVKLQILTDFFLSPNRFASSQYNLWFRATILRIFPALANRSGITLFAQQLSQLVDLINQDCTLAMMPRTAYSPGIFRSGF